LRPQSELQPVELDVEDRRELRKLACALDLGPFDLLLVGDGSGEDYTRPAGWACTAYDIAKKKAVIHAGVCTAGTNNSAELVPYIHALWFFNQEHQHDGARSYQVAVVSDSEVTVRCGNGQYQRRANGCFWSGIEWFEAHDFVFRWHHVRRNSNAWSTYADAVAGKARKAAAALQRAIIDELGYQPVRPLARTMDHE
jgi:ribonuclease HI